MNKFFKSIRLKLFFRICIVILIFLLFLIVVNNAVIETYFYYKKTQTIMDLIGKINSIESEYSGKELKKKLDYLCLENDLDIVITENGNEKYSSAENFINSFPKNEDVNYDVNYSIFNKNNILYSKDNTTIRRTSASDTGLDFILSVSKLNQVDTLYIRIPIFVVYESLTISSEFLIIVGIISMIAAGIYSFILVNRFTKPILDLREMTTRIKDMDFSEKFTENNDDEIGELGKNINALSDKLEATINQLKKNNMELERDIEEKSKIDEMRKQFISDVSHELKTPIALIEGYAEGLIENVNTDEESRNFYANVILDEANKMDKLVKRLLELMKLENEEISFNDNNFDIISLLNSVVTKLKFMTDENNIDIDFDDNKSVMVYADEFYIEQVISNYYTNAIKNIQEIDGKKEIKVSVVRRGKNYRVSIFNTGKNIEEENLIRIWNRFYKEDKSRTRLKGGNGIGLALVKAIMVKYNKEYGVINKENGVEFYFEISSKK